MKRTNLIKQSSVILLAATMGILSGCSNDTPSSCISVSNNSVNYSEMSLEGSAKKTLKADRAVVYLDLITPITLLKFHCSINSHYESWMHSKRLYN